MSNPLLSRFLSQKFRFYTFVCVALLVLVHGYNLNKTYLQPFTLVQEPLSLTTFIEYFLANGVLRFRIPLLFLISGYIYALQDSGSYKDRVIKRAKTLLIPYLIWSAVGILITWAWQSHPITAQAVADAAIDQMGDNRPYRDIGLLGVLTRWLIAPIAFQVWFIFALFVYNLLYPVILRVMYRYRVWWLGFCFALWFFELNFWILDGRGLLFFSIGVWLQKSGFNLERKPQWLSVYLMWLVFIGFCVIKTFVALELEEHDTASVWILALLHDTAVITGIVAVWYGADPVVRWCMRQPFFIWCSSFSFFIFGLHAPLVIYLTRLAYRYLNGLPEYRLLVYFMVPALVLIVCISLGALIRRWMPLVYRTTTGGRGF
jgi:fucose 4-O-acetylase-like acetyltransferase